VTGPAGDDELGWNNPEPFDVASLLDQPPSDGEAQAAQAASDADQVAARRILTEQAMYEQERARRRARRRLDVEELADQVAARRLRIVDGWAFLAEEEEEKLAIWGDGDRWAWAPGEPLMLFGGNGVFKSTLSHLLVFARLGLLGVDGAPRTDHGVVSPDAPVELWARVLDMPVQPVTGKVLYLAGDRPKQIKRAMRRLRRNWMQEILHDRLVVHEGPLPFEITDSKDALADLAERYGATDVFVDSIKDYCSKPSDEEVANGYNRARQECVARGMQWVEDHHNRKQQQGQGRTNTIEDVYGNRWLTAGAGSILSLWVENDGTPVVDVKQIKSPGELIPHLKVTVDRRTGLMSGGSRMPSDPTAFIRGAGPRGVTVAEYASFTGQTDNSARNVLNGRVKAKTLEVAPDAGDGLKRFRTVLGVVPEKPQNVWQQDGLGDF
jgi:replicative DNA helicase